MNASDDRGRDRPQQPRSEPEIIPPSRGGHERDPNARVWVWVADQDGARRASLRVPGPFTIILILALIAIIAFGLLVVALGAVLIWLPIVVLAFCALILVAMTRHYWWRFRNWLQGR
jgi:hypothetical protein